MVVFLENGVEDGVGDFVGRFVGVAFGDGFGGEEGVFAHGLEIVYFSIKM